MGKRAPAAPTPPDPVVTANAQGQMNLETARTQANLNRVDQFTPQGSIRYDRVASNAPTFEQFFSERRGAQTAPGGSWATELTRQGGDPNWQVRDEAGARAALQREYNSLYPDQDRWTATTTLAPEQQRLYDLQTQAQETYGNAALGQLRQAQGALSSPFQFAGGPMTTELVDRTGTLSSTPPNRTGELMRRPDFAGIGDPNQSRDAVEAALMSRLQPQLERDRAGLESRLANQGITMGSEAWRTGVDDFTRQANDARMGAVLGGGQEQSRVFGLGFGQAELANATAGQAGQMDLARGAFQNQSVAQQAQMDLARAQFGNQARQQGLQEQLALRGQPINEASALLSGSQLMMPQFSNVAQVGLQAPDYQGAVAQNYAGQLQNWNSRVQQVGQQNAALGSLLGTVGQAALPFVMPRAGGFGFGASSGVASTGFGRI